MSMAFKADYFTQSTADASTVQRQKPVVDVAALLAQPIKKVNYILFMKAPDPGDDKKLKAEKVEIMALNNKEE